jgi:RHS repeat-associated protein
VIRPDGKTIVLDYDNAGRRSSQTIQRGTTTYAYNDLTGNIASINSPDGGILSYTYDGSLVKSVTWQGTMQGDVLMAYDNNLRVVSESVNSGNTISFVYDNDSLLTQAGALNIGRSPQNGLVTSTSLGVLTDSRSYDSFGDLSDYRARVGSSEIFGLQYARDQLGRVTDKTETIDGISKTYTYTYDAADRLAEMKEAGITVTTYIYDSSGNRTTTIAGMPVTAVYDDQDRLVQYGETTYSYTDNGELASRTEGSQTTTYQYDELGNLIAVTLPDGTYVEYVIDGQNRRIGRKVNNVLMQGLLYKDRLSPIAELDGSGAVVSRFVYATKKNVPNYMISTGITYLIISDFLGSVRLVVNAATGDIAQHIDYDAFGNVIFDSNPGFQPFGFAGGLYDRDTKLTRFGVRDYDAETGRWTAKDPIRFAGNDVNLYEYVLGDPVNMMDPSGLLSWGDVASTLSEFAGKIKDLWKDLSGKKETIENIAETATEMNEIIGDERTPREGAKVFSCLLKRQKNFLPDFPGSKFIGEISEIAGETLAKGLRPLKSPRAR